MSGLATVIGVWVLLMWTGLLIFIHLQGEPFDVAVKGATLGAAAGAVVLVVLAVLVGGMIAVLS